MKFVTHLHLAPMFKNEWNCNYNPPYAFMACVGIASSFIASGVFSRFLKKNPTFCWEYYENIEVRILKNSGFTYRQRRFYLLVTGGVRSFGEK